MWKDDLTDTPLFGRYDLPCRGTKDLRSLKSNILRAGVCFDGGAFTVLSDGSDSVRLERRHNPDFIVDDRSPELEYAGTWYREEVRGSLNGTESWSQTEGDTCTCHFTGTGIAWISSYDILGGRAEVYLDGELVDPDIHLGVRLLTPGIARGYEKDPGRLVYSACGLKEGEHCLTIRVKGERCPGSMGSYVFIDHFRIFSEDSEGDPALIIDSEYNYPELSWGCYTKPPVRVSTGYRRSVTVKLNGRTE